MTTVSNVDSTPWTPSLLPRRTIEMVQSPSDHFITLIATLLEALPDDGSSIQDEVLLQLHAIFGSMLVAALQLIDRREVVKVLLPNGRYIYQITSATGSPYTLFAALPDRPPKPPEPAPPTDATPPPQDEPMDKDAGRISSSPTPNGNTNNQQAPRDESNGIDQAVEASQRSYAVALKRCMEGMYCPCTGYGFNTLAGDKNIFCKHLLALILAHCMDRLIHTEVYLKNVVQLLGLASGPMAEPPPVAAKEDEAVR